MLCPVCLHWVHSPGGWQHARRRRCRRHPHPPLHCRAVRLRVVTMGGDSSSASSDAPPGGDDDVDVDDDDALSNDFAKAVAAAAAKAKSSAAREFVRAYNLQQAAGMGMGVDAGVRSRLMLLRSSAPFVYTA